SYFCLVSEFAASAAWARNHCARSRHFSALRSLSVMPDCNHVVMDRHYSKRHSPIGASTQRADARERPQIGSKWNTAVFLRTCCGHAKIVRRISADQFSPNLLESMVP